MGRKGMKKREIFIVMWYYQVYKFVKLTCGLLQNMNYCLCNNGGEIISIFWEQKLQ